MTESAETIITRFMRLNQLLLGKSSYSIPRKHLVHRDALLDILFALYEECNVDYLRKNKNINSFIDKFKLLMPELKALRVNLNDFEIKRVIGRGHFGTVNVVKEKATGDVYAMKVLCKQETLSQQNIAFYEEERDIMIKSNSPWLTKLHYAFQDVHKLYLVMEFHPGGDMVSLLQKNDYMLPEDMCKFYLAELVLAINSVHSMGYVHRDIKPDNILIDRTGHIKLADFGSAAKLNIKQQVTSSMPVGTPDYIAPEVLTAMNAIPASSISYGIECDWWSLGIVAFEMVFGFTPFADDKVLFTYSNIMNFKNFTFPPEASEVSESLIDLIKNLLQEAAKRFGYDKLTVHTFFLDIDWNNIRNTAPPFLPIVSSVDDTSYFDEFEPENRPTFSDLKLKKEFSGKNLPFVGFSYTPSFESSAEKSVMLEDSINFQSTDSIEPSVPKSRAILELEKELSHRTEMESSLKSEIQKLKDYILTKEKEMEIIKRDKTFADELNVELRAEIEHVKELVAYEHDHRVLTEKKACHLIKCMKQKRKQDAIILKAKGKEFRPEEKEKLSIEEMLMDANLKIEELVKEKADLLSDLYDTKQMLLECQKKLTEKEQDITSELNKSLNSSVMNESLKTQSPIVEKKLIKKLERKNIGLEQDLDLALKGKQEAQVKILSLQKIIDEMKSQSGLTEVSTDNTLDRCIRSDSSVNNSTSLSQNGWTTATESVYVTDSATSVGDIYPSELEESEVTSSLQEKSGTEISEKETIMSEFQQKLIDAKKEKDEIQRKLLDTEKELKIQIAEVKTLTDKIKILEDEVSSLKKSAQKELKVEKETSEDKDCAWVKKSQSRIERQDRLVLSDLKHENNLMKTKIESLSSEISDLRTKLKNKENSFIELEKQLSEKNRALSDAQLDLRVSTRKEHLTDTLRERNKELRDQLKAKEQTILEKIKAEEELRVEMKTLESEVSELKTSIQEKDKEFEIEKAKYDERLKALKDTCEDSKGVEQKYAKTQGQYEEIVRQNTNLSKECEEKTKEILQLKAEIKNIKNDFTKKQAECSRFEKIISTLKSACIDMENDLNDFETLVEARDVKIVKLTNERDQLKDEVIKCKGEIRNLKSSFEKDGQQREEMLKHVQELTDELENRASAHETEMQILQEELNHYKRSVEELEKQASDLQSDASFNTKDTANYCKKILDLESQLCLIKEEAAAHITQISSLRGSNFKLTQSLDEALKKLEFSEKNFNELANEKESEKVKYDHEKVKLQETISQQTKLIDFLQTKTESMEKKKKPIARLFGKRDVTPQPLQSRDVEKALETERNRCRRLQDQLSQERAEKMILQREISNLQESLTACAETPATPNSRAMHAAITSSPGSISETFQAYTSSSQGTEKIVKPPGMKHKIPHRFSEVMCMRNSKCCICLDSMYLGRSIVKCQECNIESHVKCASSLPKTCGLPTGYLQHFKTKVRNSLSSDPTQDTSNNISEGWLKMQKSNKHGWDKRYIRLKNNVLYIFENSEEEDPEDAMLDIDFSTDKATVNVFSAVSASELPHSASSDLPFVLKIESFPLTTCWPKRCLYFMTSNFNEKQMWVSALEKAAESNKVDIESSQKKLDKKIVWTVKGDKAIDPLCTYIWDEETLLLGAAEGIFVLAKNKENSFTLINEIKEIPYVYQIICVEKIGIALFINGDERILSFVDLNTLKLRLLDSTDQPLSLKPVADVINCHLFAVNDNKDMPFICSATSQTIMLCQYDATLKAFCNKKVMTLNEPCNCIYFSQDQMIFGTDVFYVLSLSDFELKPFLDGSDAALAGLVYGAPQFRSFPLAIFQISENNQNPEYLLCFHEMGVFVNSQGRKTRSEDMKWSRLPLSLAYRFPYLFITHLNFVEVIEIPSQTKSTKGNKSVVGVPIAQFMGWAHTPTSIFVSSKHNQAVNLFLIDGSQIGNYDLAVQKDDDISSVSSSPKNNNGIRSLPESEDLDFSFTSSIDTFDEKVTMSEESVDN